MHAVYVRHPPKFLLRKLILVAIFGYFLFVIICTPGESRLDGNLICGCDNVGKDMLDL